MTVMGRFTFFTGPSSAGCSAVASACRAKGQSMCHGVGDGDAAVTPGLASVTLGHSPRTGPMLASQLARRLDASVARAAGGHARC